MPFRHALLVTAVLALAAPPAAPSAADTLTLADGSVLEGKTRTLGSSVSIKLPDGSVRLIPKDQITAVNGKPLGDGPAAADKPGGGGGASFGEVKQKADRVDAPIVAVSLWERFLKTPDLSAEDKAAAEAELAGWKALQDSGAEKIRGKWVGGEEREALMEQVKALIEEAAAAEDTSTRTAIQKYQQALALYPDSFEANFRLGYFNLVKGGHGQIDQAVKSLERAVFLRPGNPEALNNLAIAYNFDRNYPRSVSLLWRACEQMDDKALVQNLANALFQAPRGMLRNNPIVRRVYEDARPLFAKHGVAGPQGAWTYLPPGWSDVGRAADGQPPVEAEGGPPGVAGNGSGFFVSPDGYLLTNKHVVEDADGYFYRVRLDDGQEYLAEIVAVDDEHDVALLKVDLPEDRDEVPYLDLFAGDFPGAAAEALGLGYPATGKTIERASMQVSRGAVQSINEGDEHEVWLDLNTTRGNSGGPVVDRNGDVIGIVTAGRTVYDVTYVMAVSPRQIRDFLDGLGEDKPALPADRPEDRPFDGEALAAEARKATLLVIIVRGEVGGSDE